MTDPAEILPCPFCGDAMQLSDGIVAHIVQTPRCPIDMMGFQMNRVDWNRRAIPAADTSALGAVAINEELNTPESVAFWNWLPLAYRDGHVGERPKFTKYNMEVSHLAGWQHALKSLEPPTHADLLTAALALPEVAAIVKAAKAMQSAVCGPTGFAEAVRHNSGLAYPWPSLDAAEAKVNTALSALEARHDTA